MITVTSITIEGFKSFKTPCTVDIVEEDRFVLVSGVNKLEPELGANGCGKTSIWDALTWCLFGKTTRGSRGPDVANREDVALCDVYVVFWVEDQEYRLERTYKPNTLVLFRGDVELPVTVTQEEVDDLLGCQYETFLHTVVLGQFSRLFFDLSPTEKLKLFTNVLNLDLWTQAADRAKGKSISAGGDLIESEADMERLKGRKEATTEQLAEMRNLDADHQAGKRNHMAELEKERRGYKERASGFKRSVRENEDLVAQAHIDLDSIRKDETVASSKVGALTGNGDKLHLHRTNLKVKRKQIKKTMAALKALNAKCPTCTQPVTPTIIEKSVKRLRKDLVAVDNSVDRVLGEIELATKRLDKWLDKLTGFRAGVGSLVTTIQCLNGDKNRAGDNYKMCKDQLADVDRKMTKVEKSVGPYRGNIKNLKLDLKAIKKDEKQLAKHIRIMKRRRNRYDFWAKEFKQVRLWIVGECLKELEIQTNNSLLELGLKDWKVGFEVERENKTGGVTRGFTVTVKPPGDGAHGTAWESWSGGETQRLRIAGAVGFASLVGSVTGFDCNLEVWDEPTAHLSGEGVTDLLDFLSNRSRVLEKNLMLIDHQSLESGLFDANLHVIKNEGGSLVDRK